MLRSMRARLTLAFALSIAVVMGLLSSAVVVYSRQLEATQLARTLEKQAHQYRADLKAGKGTPHDWKQFLTQESRKLRGAQLSMRVLDKKGDLIAHTQTAGSNWPMNGDWLVETVNYEGATLVLSAPWHSTEHEINELARKLALLTLGTVVATALGAWLLVGKVLSPIVRLSHEADAASTDELKVKLRAPSSDAEVVDLVSTLNFMLERVAETAQAKGRFYAAASHELRTPLQGLGSLLEYGLTRPRTSEQWEEIAREAWEQSRQLSQLTTDLLALNQLEMATSRPAAVEVDVADLIERILGHLEPQIQDRNLQIELDLPSEGEFMAPWNLLEMSLRNLLENAVKYSRPHSTISVSWEVDEGYGHFSVWNSADLPPQLQDEAELQKLFEPFFRLDSSRLSTTGGNGLGLSIVAAISRSNFWEISLTPQNDGLLAQLKVPQAVTTT